MLRIRVNKGGTAYLSDEIRSDGYIGILEAWLAAACLIIPKPNSKCYDVAISLRIMADKFEHMSRIYNEGPFDYNYESITEKVRKGIAEKE